jgi:translation initiation factor 3 subunit D
VILGVMSHDPRKFGDQLGVNLNNGWGIVRTIIDMVRSREGNANGDAKFVLVKDPNKPLLRLYDVPLSTFEEGDDDDEGTQAEGEGEAEEGEGEE